MTGPRSEMSEIEWSACLIGLEFYTLAMLEKEAALADEAVDYRDFTASFPLFLHSQCCTRSAEHVSTHTFHSSP